MSLPSCAIPSLYLYKQSVYQGFIMSLPSCAIPSLYLYENVYIYNMIEIIIAAILTAPEALGVPLCSNLHWCQLSVSICGSV